MYPQACTLNRQSRMSEIDDRQALNLTTTWKSWHPVVRCVPRLGILSGHSPSNEKHTYIGLSKLDFDRIYMPRVE